MCACLLQNSCFQNWCVRKTKILISLTKIQNLLTLIFFTQAYRDTLQLTCEANGAQQYGWVNWTVAPETQDVVYYQSYYAYGLGWKIYVLNEGEEPNRAAHPSMPLNSHYAGSLAMTIIIGIVSVMLLWNSVCGLTWQLETVPMMVQASKCVDKTSIKLAAIWESLPR